MNKIEMWSAAQCSVELDLWIEGWIEDFDYHANRLNELRRNCANDNVFLERVVTNFEGTEGFRKFERLGRLDRSIEAFALLPEARGCISQDVREVAQFKISHPRLVG